MQEKKWGEGKEVEMFETETLDISCNTEEMLGKILENLGQSVENLGKTWNITKKLFDHKSREAFIAVK
jgi:hypothetical protein